MDVVNIENLNAIKFFLVLEKSKIAAQFKLEEEIHCMHANTPSTSKASTASDSTCVSEFLKITYNILINKYRQNEKKLNYLQSFIKALNPEYPTERPQDKPFPNDLKLFDIPSCYQIAVELKKKGFGFLNEFDDLREMRNNFFHTSKIGDVEKIKEIIKYFCKNDADLKKRLEEQLEQIELLKVNNVSSHDYELYQKTMLEVESLRNEVKTLKKSNPFKI